MLPLLMLTVIINNPQVSAPYSPPTGIATPTGPAKDYIVSYGYTWDNPIFSFGLDGVGVSFGNLEPSNSVTAKLNFESTLAPNIPYRITLVAEDSYLGLSYKNCWLCQYQPVPSLTNLDSPISLTGNHISFRIYPGTNFNKLTPYRTNVILTALPSY
jgi:hypothetical protein